MCNPRGLPPICVGMAGPKQMKAFCVICTKFVWGFPIVSPKSGAVRSVRNKKDKISLKFLQMRRNPP